MASPLKPKAQSTSSDLFSEFENFRSQIKKEYNEKILQGRTSTLQDDIFRLKATNVSNNPSKMINPISNAKSTIYSTLPLKSSTNKENIEKGGSFIDIGAKKSNFQIENLKKSLKELSAKKPDKNRDNLVSSLHFGRDNQNFRASADIKKPSDYKSLLSNFENIRSKGNLDNASYRFGTAGALAELENRAKLMVPSPTKRIKAENLLSSFESSNKKSTMDFGDSKGFAGKWEEKKIMMKVMELQDLIIDLNDQEFNEYSNQY
jgi:hypothetical protein